MAEPEYPSVHGVFQGLKQKIFRVAFTDLSRAESAAQHARYLQTSVVELIPRPVHERLVAEAVAKAVSDERERLARSEGKY